MLIHTIIHRTERWEHKTGGVWQYISFPLAPLGIVLAAAHFPLTEHTPRDGDDLYLLVQVGSGVCEHRVVEFGYRADAMIPCDLRWPIR